MMVLGSLQGDPIVLSDDEDQLDVPRQPYHPAVKLQMPSEDTPSSTQRLATNGGGSQQGSSNFDGQVMQIQLQAYYAADPNNGATERQSQVSETNSPAQKHDEPCPYYYDEKFGLKMYRGAGFERFHPVLGSMAEHQEICDEWDERQSKARNGGICVTNKHSEFIDSSARIPGGYSAGGGTQQEDECLEKVLLVFPQIRHEFVRTLCRKRLPVSITEPPTLLGSLSSEVIIGEIAELDSYPFQKSLKRKRSRTFEEDDVTINWDKKAPKNPTYYKEALALLADVFDRVPTHFISKVLLDNQSSLFESYHSLTEYECQFYSSQPKPYGRLRLGRVGLEKKYLRTSLEKREANQFSNLVNELQAAKQHQTREGHKRRKEKAANEAEASNFELHKLQGSLIDCQCCFDDVPINRTVNCENDQSHFFCNACINRRAEHQIGGLEYKMGCIDTSGCDAELSEEALARALPPKVFEKLAEIRQQAEIKAAGLEGLEQCPFCDFQGVCAAIEVDSIFRCLNSQCEEHSCRKCRASSHLPRTCEEARKDTGLEARHAVEEARSEAIMRSCPKCRVKIIKSDGCNKMTCQNCRTMMCYVCNEDITTNGYTHFAARTSTCPLSDRPGQNRHEIEADGAEQSAIAAAKARDDQVNEEDLRIGALLNRQAVQADGLHRPIIPLNPGQGWLGQFYAVENMLRDQNRYNDRRPGHPSLPGQLRAGPPLNHVAAAAPPLYLAQADTNMPPYLAQADMNMPLLRDAYTNNIEPRFPNPLPPAFGAHEQRFPGPFQ